VKHKQEKYTNKDLVAEINLIVPADKKIDTRKFRVFERAQAGDDYTFAGSHAILTAHIASKRYEFRQDSAETIIADCVAAIADGWFEGRSAQVL